VDWTTEFKTLTEVRIQSQIWNFHYS